MQADWLFEGGPVLACDSEGRTADWLWVQQGRVRALGTRRRRVWPADVTTCAGAA